MRWCDDYGLLCRDDEDKIEPLQMSKQQQIDAIQEDDASYLLSNLQGQQQQDGAGTNQN